MTQSPPNDRRGIVTVEFAVVLPFLVVLLLGLWEVGRLLDVQMALESAAGVGGRRASTGVTTDAQVRQAVTSCLESAGLPTQHATVTVQNLTNPGTDVSQASQLDQLQITVSLPFRDVRWAVSGFVTNDRTLVAAKAFYYSARVERYPTNIQPPPGY